MLHKHETGELQSPNFDKFENDGYDHSLLKQLHEGLDDPLRKVAEIYHGAIEQDLPLDTEQQLMISELKTRVMHRLKTLLHKMKHRSQPSSYDNEVTFEELEAWAAEVENTDWFNLTDFDDLRRSYLRFNRR